MIRSPWLVAPAATLVVALVAGGCVAPAEMPAPSSANPPAAAPAGFAYPYPTLASRIVTSLKPTTGERVLLRYNPDALGPLEPELRRQLEAKGAVVESLQYGEAPAWWMIVYPLGFAAVMAAVFLPLYRREEPHLAKVLD